MLSQTEWLFVDRAVNIPGSSQRNPSSLDMVDLLSINLRFVEERSMKQVRTTILQTIAGVGAHSHQSGSDNIRAQTDMGNVKSYAQN